MSRIRFVARTFLIAALASTARAQAATPPAPPASPAPLSAPANAAVPASPSAADCAAAAAVAGATCAAAAVAAAPAAAAAGAPAVAVTPPTNPPTPAQLDKFHSIYQDATKVFGGEHTVISPSFFLATDIAGRLSATQKRQAGVSGMLMLPLIGAGGNHGVDWWPVVATADEAKVYQMFLDQLNQYQQALPNVESLSSKVAAVKATKWDLRRLKVAVQLFCEEDLDPELLSVTQTQIDTLCKNKKNITSSSLDLVPPPTSPASPASSAAPAPAAQSSSTPPLKPEDAREIADAVKSADPSTLVPRRHNFLLGPALGIPITNNPTDIFQLGAAAEMGDDAFRIMATGGFVGRYQGGTLKDIFGAGWFVGVALSGEIGDEVFHYFNGGSNLLAQLAQVKSTTP